MSWDVLCSILARRWRVVAVAVVLGLAGAVAATLLITPRYSASTTLRLATAIVGSSDQVNYDIVYSDRLMNTYRKLATSDSALDEIVQKYSLAEPPTVSVDLPANTEIIRINVHAREPHVAAQAANGLADLLMNTPAPRFAPTGQTAQEILSQQLSAAKADLDRARQAYDELSSRSDASGDRLAAARRALDLKQDTYDMVLRQYDRARMTEVLRSSAFTVIDPAIPPTAPSQPQPILNLGLGLFLGCLVGLGMALVLERLDTTLYSSRRVEALTGMPALGRIPLDSRSPAHLLFEAGTSQAKAFYRLGVSLLAISSTGASKTILVTSAMPGEGTSTVVSNLAVAIATAGMSVAVVDAHTHAPTLHTVFRRSNRIGLTGVLRGQIPVERAMQETDVARVTLLAGGPPLEESAGVVNALLLSSILGQMAASFDVVLVDCPPLLAVPDTTLLVQTADTVLFVVGRGLASEESVRTAAQQLSDLRVKSVGLVVNRSEPDPAFAEPAPTAERAESSPRSPDHAGADVVPAHG